MIIIISIIIIITMKISDYDNVRDTNSDSVNDNDNNNQNHHKFWNVTCYIINLFWALIGQWTLHTCNWTVYTSCLCNWQHVFCAHARTVAAHFAEFTVVVVFLSCKRINDGCLMSNFFHSLDLSVTGLSFVQFCL